MADGCLLLVDAFEGPMPQTTFRAAQGLRIRPAADRGHQQDRPRPTPGPRTCSTRCSTCSSSWAPTRKPLDFPTIYTSATEGYATLDPARSTGRHLRPVRHDPQARAAAARSSPTAPLQMLITTLDYSDYVGRIGIGRVFAGTLRAGQPVAVLHRDGTAARTSRSASCSCSTVSAARKVDAGGRRRHLRRRRARARSTSATRIADPDDPQPLPLIAHRRADAAHDLPRQRLALRRALRQVPHQPRTSATGWRRSCSTTSPCASSPAHTPEEFHVSGRGAAAPVGAGREHAPRGLRAGGRQAEGDLPRAERQEDRADRAVRRRRAHRARRPGHGTDGRPPRRSARRWRPAATGPTSSSRSPRAA